MHNELYVGHLLHLLDMNSSILVIRTFWFLLPLSISSCIMCTKADHGLVETTDPYLLN